MDSPLSVMSFLLTLEVRNTDFNLNKCPQSYDDEIPQNLHLSLILQHTGCSSESVFYDHSLTSS